MGMEHVGTTGLVCFSEGLKILPDVCEGLLGVCGILLGSILAIEVIDVITFPHPLEIQVIGAMLVNKG